MLSYPIYLIHQNVGYIILKALINRNITTEWIIIIPTVIVILYSLMIYRFIEIPIKRKQQELYLGEEGLG